MIPAAGERVRVRVNGEDREMEPGTTVTSLLLDLGVTMTTVAVERNREILPKPRYSGTVIHDGDQLEVVQFVGGG